MRSPDFFFTYHTFEAAGEKRAEVSPRAECDQVMQRIYAENPSFWPHGLSADMLDGGAYLVRDAHTKQAFGFAGWQERAEGPKKIGYYAIGILPEHRNAGLAKQAVANLIRQKAATVDEVRAFIVPGNTPSVALANSLGVTVQTKSASSVMAKFIVPGILGGATNAAIWDAKNHNSAPFAGHWDADRVSENAINGLLFGVSAGILGGMGIKSQDPKHIVSAATLMGMTPAKDLLIRANSAMPDFRNAAHAYAENSPKAQDQASELAQAARGISKRDMLLAGGGIAGLGLLGAALYKGMSKLRANDGARVKVQLPGPHGTTTEVEMPVNQLGELPTHVTNLLQRDVRRRMRVGFKYRTEHLKNRQLISQLEEDEANLKEASLHGPHAKPTMRNDTTHPTRPNNPMQVSNFVADAQEEYNRKQQEGIQAKQEQEQQAQQAQQQQQHELQLAQAKQPMPEPAPAPATPAPVERKLSPSIAHMASTAMRATNKLTTKLAAEETFSPAAKPTVPEASAVPKPVVPEAHKLQAPATTPAPAPTPVAPAAPAPTPVAPAAPATHPVPPALQKQYDEMKGRGMTMRATANNGIAGVDAKGNKTYIDSYGRKKFFAAPSDVASDPKDYMWGSLQDWAHGREGTSVTDPNAGFFSNPLQWTGNFLENGTRAIARTTMGMMDMGDAVQNNDWRELGNASLRTAGSLADASGRVVAGAGIARGAAGLASWGAGKVSPTAAALLAPALAGSAGLQTITLPGAARLAASNSKLFKGLGTAYTTAGTLGVPAALQSAADAWDGESQRPLDISGSDDPRLQHLLGQSNQPPTSQGLAPGRHDNSYNLTAANLGYGPGVLSAADIGADVRTPFDNTGGIAGTIAGLLGRYGRDKMFGGSDHNVMIGGQG